MKEKISVIIPAFNAEKWIYNCVKSVLNQNDNNFEIIIVNDGSKDNTLTLCKELGYNDNRIMIVDKKNGGVSRARNEGIKRATGKWVVFLDSDDCLCKDAFEKFRKIESNICNYDIVIFNYIINSAGMPQRECAFLNGDSRICTEEKEDIIVSCLSNKLAGNAIAPINIGVPWGKVYRREFLAKQELAFPDGVSHMEDTVFNLQAFKKASNIYFYNSSFYIYSINTESVTNQCTANFDRKAERVFKLFNEVLSDCLTDKIKIGLQYKGLCLYTQFLQVDCFNIGIKDNFRHRMTRCIEVCKKNFFPSMVTDIYNYRLKRFLIRGCSNGKDREKKKCNEKYYIWRYFKSVSNCSAFFNAYGYDLFHGCPVSWLEFAFYVNSSGIKFG